VADKNPVQYVEDAFGVLPDGMNSGLSPLLLEKTQLSFGSNLTVRNGYATDRPPIIRKTIDFQGDTALQTAIEKGLWQTFIFYQPIIGDTKLMVSISGRVFEFSEQLNGEFTVIERTIPSDPNPATQPQAWMVQAEQFLILNDGVSVPYIWDGSIARRAQTNTPTVYGITNADFTVPQVGASVTINIASGYTGPLNVAIYIGGHIYVVTNQSNNTQAYSLASVKNVNGVAGSTVDAGTPVIIKGTGLIVGTTTTGFAFNDFFLHDLGLDTSTAQTTVADNSIVTILGRRFRKNGTKFAIQSGPFPFVVPAGSQVISTGAAQPDQTIATVYEAFTVPAIGSSVTVKTTSLYSGADNQAVQINSKNFEISKTTQPPTPPATLIVSNVNDSPGNTVISGTDLASGALVGVSTELPPGRMLVYGMGRIWECLTDGKQFVAGDIVGGSSGTQTYNYTDSVLRVTENSYLAGGGNFRTPSSGGTINAMIFTATLDVFIGTRADTDIHTIRSVFMSGSGG
jgi:hypothetical protein